MNILVLCVDAFPKMGGVSTMAHHLVSEFSNKEHRCIFLGPQGTYIPDDYDRNYTLIEDFESNVKHREGAHGKAQDLRIQELLSRIVDDYQVDFILNVHPFYYGVAACEVSENKGIALGTYFHGFEFRSQVLHGLPNMQRAISAPSSLPERTVNVAVRSNFVFVNSKYTGSLLQEVRDSKPIIVTGCGLDTDVVQREIIENPDLARGRWLGEIKRGSQFTVTYIGRLVPSKRVDRVISILSHCENMNAIIIGDGPERARLDELAAKLGVTKRCKFMGQVSEEEKFSVLRNTDFIALLSERNDQTGNVEGFGISLLEGAACGAIPMTSGTGGMIDIVSSPELGLVLNDDDRLAATQLAELAASPLRMKKISANIRSKIVSDFNWSRVCDKILEVFNETTC